MHGTCMIGPERLGATSPTSRATIDLACRPKLPRPPWFAKFAGGA